MRRLLAACGFVLLASVQIASAQSLNLKQVATCSVGNFNTPFLTVDTAGTLCTSAGGGGGGGTSSTFGAAFPATGTAAGFSDGTNMVAGRATSGALSSAFTPPTSGLQQVQSFGMVWNGATWDRATAASGGLSIQDQAAFTAGASNFTPGGGVFNDTATLTSGQQGTFRMTTKRAQIMDVDTTGNALYSAITAPVPAGTNLIGDVNLRQGGTVLSATNGIYSNQLQGNAVLSATNPSFSRPTDGTSARVFDPCEVVAHVTTPISISSAATSIIVAGTSAKKTYICSMMLMSAGTTNVGIVQGSGSTCGTSTLGLIGGTTSGTGPNLTAQAGFVAGNGNFAIAGTTVNANDICLINGSAIQVSGYIVTATP